MTLYLLRQFPRACWVSPTSVRQPVQGETPVDFRVVIGRDEAERELSRIFPNEPFPVRDILDDLLKYHLLQNRGINQIEFRHQLIQDYYAAEHLLQLLPTLNDEQLKRDYLNYLKWTEAIALMLALSEVPEMQAVKVVELALGADLMLGARLAGEVNQSFQQRTIKLVNECKLLDGGAVPQWLRIELLGRMRSQAAFLQLTQALNSNDTGICRQAARWLAHLGMREAIPELQKRLTTLELLVQQQGFESNLDIMCRSSFNEALLELSSEDDAQRLRGKLLEALNNNWRLFDFLGMEKLFNKFIDDADLAELFKALKDQQSEARRANATSILGELGNKAAILELERALDDPSASVRHNAVKALGKFNTEEALDGLIEALKDPDSSVFEEASRSLIELNNQAAVPGLRQLLSCSNWMTSWRSAQILGHLESEEALPKLRQGVQHKHPDIRRISVEALSRLKCQQATLELLDCLKKDLDYSVRRSAAIALGCAGEEEAIPELLKALRHYHLPADLGINVEVSVKLNGHKTIIQGMAEEELKALGGEWAAQRWLWEHRNLDVRLQVAKALGEIGSDQALRALSEGLEYPSQYTRCAAAIVLGQFGREEAVSELLEALKDVDDPDIRKEIIAVLAKVSNKQVIDELLKLLQNNTIDSDIRWSIASTLGKIDEKKIAEYLPYFTTLIPSKVGQQSLQIILQIQGRCRYYNHKIWQEAIQSQEQAHLKRQTTQASHSEAIARIDQTTQQIDQRTRQMISEPKNNFSGATFNAPVNFGDNPTGAFIGTQNNYPTDPELQYAIAELQTLLTQLQIQHPHVTTEIEAIAITHAKLTEIKQSKTPGLANLRKQLLNPERHFQATKATLGEIAKHYLEESVWAKAILTYLDKLSEDPNLGA